MFNYFSFAVLIFFIYLLLYSIIDRICKCIERCSYTKYGANNDKFIEKEK